MELVRREASKEEEEEARGKRKKKASKRKRKEKELYERRKQVARASKIARSKAI